MFFFELGYVKFKVLQVRCCKEITVAITCLRNTNIHFIDFPGGLTLTVEMDIW